MTRTKATAPKRTGDIPLRVPPAPDSHPAIAGIIQGLNELWRNRYRNLVAHSDALENAAPRHQPAGDTPPSAISREVARSSPRPGPRRLRGQALIHSIPLEIFVEIGKYLHPYDLYSFAMSCTHLNRMLMSKSTRSLWKARLGSIVLSDPLERAPIRRPEFMNELQYVVFLFGQRCMACDASQECTTFWSLYLRLCSRCQPLNMASVPELMEFIRSTNPRATKAKMLEMIHAIASSDQSHRTPLGLLQDQDTTTFRMRDEAQLIISTLLGAQKTKTRTRAKRSMGINHLVAAVSRISNCRIRTGAAFRGALAVLRPGAGASV